MKGKLLAVLGIAALVLLSGCAIPAELMDDVIPPGLLPPSEAEFTQECGERGGEVCGADEVCRGSTMWSVGSPLGNFSCCDMTCGEITEDDECRTRTDCDDGNSSTGDRCTGTPMKCIHFPQTCEGGICFGGAPRAIEDPLREDPCAEVNCPNGQECVRGKCEPINIEDRFLNIPGIRSTQTCEEQGGNICNLDEVCKGSVTRTSDSDYCCNMICGEITEDECQTITINPYRRDTNECDDENFSTGDWCRGTPKRCFHTVMVCNEVMCTAPPPPI